MRSIAAILMLVLIGLRPAPAAELPSRKPGLWQVKTGIGSAPTRVIQQCIDASTDQMLQSSAGPFNPATCSKRDVQRSDNSITIDSTCVLDGKPATARAVATGSFDSAYTMTVTSQSPDIPDGQMTMTMDARWLGPCAADQKPGDIIMSNGMKINVPEMAKRGASPDVPQPSR